MALLYAPRPAPETDRPAPPPGLGPYRVPRPLISSAAAGAVGVLATAVGAGLGIRHLQKIGLSVDTVIGLVLLGCGLLLLAFAATVGWKALRRWHRLWLAPVALVALAVTFSGAEAVMATNVPRTVLGGASPADRGLSYSDVEFTTGDGVRLSAWFVPSSNGAAVVLLHGAGENRSATLGQAAVLAKHGYGALIVDARGQGRSLGSAMDFGWYGDADIAAAVTFLAHQPGVDPARIGLLGLSMGGEEAIGAAGSDPRIRAVVAEGATHRTATDKAGWLPGGVAGGLQRAIDWMTYGFTAMLTDASEPTPLYDAIARSSATRFLLIAAGRVPDEARAAAYFRGAAPDRVQVWQVPGASHTHALSAQPAQWSARVLGFFGHTLLARP